MNNTQPAPQSGQVMKWSDSAMYRSEEMPFDVNQDGPQVTLLNASPEPLAAIAATSKIYKGEVVRNFADITVEEREDYISQIEKTHLKMPFETVQMHFLIEGVTRSFTHQIVRQRTAAYAQESLRFAVKEDFTNEVALPPSIAELRKDDPRRVQWDRSVETLNGQYNALVNAGVPAEDARGLLPHNITTRLHYITNLRGLEEHAGNRLCVQAQHEWRMVWLRIIEAISNYETPGGSDNWEWRRVAQLFKPICFKTGKCEFMANFDRHCSIRDRVNTFHEKGVTSDQWTAGRVDLGIPAIRPEEWLFDHNAARVRA